MKILITGGAGFIGSTLANELTKNHQVVVFDNFSTGKVENLDFSNNLKVIEGDITDYEFINNELLADFDVIYHLAAIASVAASVESPYYCNEVNFKATLNIIEQIKKNTFKAKFIFASSAAVYGDNDNLPLNENDSVRPLSPYAIDKYAAEQYVINYANLYGINASAARFFNVYGPNQDPKSPYSGVISILMDTMLDNNKVFRLFGDGSQTRDFVYVEDLVNALILLGSSKESGEVYNIGTGNNITLNELIDTIQQVASKRIEVKRLPFRNADVRESQANIDKIKKIGYTPRFSIKTGLQKFYVKETKKMLEIV